MKLIDELFHEMKINEVQMQTEEGQEMTEAPTVL